MARRMVCIDERFFLRWGCSDCNWEFNPSGPPIGESLQEMKQNFKSRRDREFASHVCANYPRTYGHAGTQRSP